MPLRHGLAAALGLLIASGASARTFRFTYEAEITPPAGPGPVHVFIPIAQDGPQQRILSWSSDTSIPGAIELEREHGNRFWHGVIASPDGKPVHAAFTYLVERTPFEAAPAAPRRLARDASQEQAEWLEPDAKVPVGVPILDPILEEIRASAKGKGKAGITRSAYDWLVDHVEYKKEGTGWGQGDVYWACSQRYGNCTDFHSLFNAISRTEGIPSRFEIGFPVPMDKSRGTIGGYHCWTWFWLQGTGWLPLDASDAAKNKVRREDLYGKQPADRVHFTTGRDLALGPNQKSGPLNFFIHPVVEVNGERLTEGIKTTFGYEEAAGR